MSSSTFKLEAGEIVTLTREFELLESELTKAFKQLSAWAANSFNDLELFQWDKCEEIMDQYEKVYGRYQRLASRLGRTPNNYLPDHLDDLRGTWARAGTSSELMHQAHLYMVDRLLPYLKTKRSGGTQVLEEALGRQHLVLVKNASSITSALRRSIIHNLMVAGGPLGLVLQMPSALIHATLGSRPLDAILISDLSPIERETLLTLFGGSAFSTLKAAKDAALAL